MVRPLSRAVAWPLLAMLGLCALPAGSAGAAKLVTIWSFRGGTTDGAYPSAPLVARKGELFGTTGNGGAGGFGAVFRLQPAKSGGKWREAILYSFQGPPADGSRPTNIVIGPTGTIYGSTVRGGSCGGVCIGGTVFQLVEPASKQAPWTETVLHQFTGGDGGSSTDGSAPEGLALGPSGSLVGTTFSGGGAKACGSDNGQPLGCGTLFKLTPPAAGDTSWTESSASFNGALGAFPDSPPTVAQGYGIIAASQGGPNKGVSNISPNGSVPVDCRKLGKGLLFARNMISAFNFAGVNGSGPIGQPTERPLTPAELDTFAKWCKAQMGGSVAAGRPLTASAVTPYFFGTTGGGGGNPLLCPALASNGCGLVYGLTPPAGAGTWSQTLLHEFAGGVDGALPEGALLDDANGVLWGTTYGDDVATDYGTVFSLTPDAASSTGYDYAVVHQFASTDGANPSAGLIELNGVLYGTTSDGGAHGYGTVFAITP